ncbi:hypothetical protein GCM10022631_25610 [Deinococcus rubellus]|uniref:type II toxin-antitoxin system Phd/YefM family antitoxin n=1 Tax=Deinococcus rubellus TaxID=1889240 RepID=UPI0031ECBDE1
MRSVGIKELKDQASAIVSGGEAVIIEKCGRPVGMYVPLGEGQGDKGKVYQLAENVQRLMAEIVAQNNLTPDALAGELELLAHKPTTDEHQASRILLTAVCWWVRCRAHAVWHCWPTQS